MGVVLPDPLPPKVVLKELEELVVPVDVTVVYDCQVLACHVGVILESPSTSHTPPTTHFHFSTKPSSTTLPHSPDFLPKKATYIVKAKVSGKRVIIDSNCNRKHQQRCKAIPWWGYCWWIRWIYPSVTKKKRCTKLTRFWGLWWIIFATRAYFYFRVNIFIVLSSASLLFWTLSWHLRGISFLIWPKRRLDVLDKNKMRFMPSENKKCEK